MSVDIAEQVSAKVSTSKFGFNIQLDQSTDINHCCQLLFYVLFTQNDEVKTELLQGKPNSKAKHKECSPTNFKLSMTSSYSTLAFRAI